MSRKVIDINERLPSKDPLEKLKGMRVRLDLEQAKVAIPMSLLSILAVVTMLNSQMFSAPQTAAIQSRDLASEGVPARGIASLPTGTSAEEDSLVRRLGEEGLSAGSTLGRKPTALERFTLGALEGQYDVMLDGEKVRALTLSPSARPVAFGDKFLDQHREFLPAQFDKVLQVGNKADDRGRHLTFQLVNRMSLPVATVDVQLDAEGRLLSLKVAPEARTH